MSTSDDQPAVLRVAREGERTEHPEPLRLGDRVRALRRELGWTLEQAATRAGLARSTLSKIENGQMSPTFDAVQKLAHGLGISVPQLFTPPSREAPLARQAITRRGAGRPLVTATYEHELLAGALTRKKLMPYRTRVRARDMAAFDGWVRHDGEEFLYVLTGRIRFYTEHYEPVEMERGDSAYYDAGMGHNVVSISDDDAEILWVTTLI